MAQRLDVLDRMNERLLEIIRTALPLITASVRDADLAGLAHLRAEMVHAMEEYARYVQQHVVDTASAGDAEHVRSAQEMKIGCLALEQAYRAFADRWRHRDGIANWPEYRLSAIVMVKQLRNHLRTASRRESVETGLKLPD